MSTVRHTRRCADLEDVIPSHEGTWQFAEDYLPTDEVLSSATRRSAEVGVPSVSRGAGALLRFFAATVGARNVVEVGTGTGVSGLWLLRGMRADGVLTTVDLEGEHLRLARESFAADNIAANRTRLITGRALDVLPRLADGAYDLMFIDGPADEHTACLEEAVRLLRPGGIVVFGGALGQDKVADATQRDAETVSRRALVNAVRDDERLTSVLVHAGDGLLVAVLN